MSDPQPSMRLTSQTVTGVVRKGATVLLLALGAGYGVSGQQQPPNLPESFRFRTGVELINVTATVTDSRGRFVSGLQKDDFLVYEDGELQPVTHFSNERVPVSLGIALDTSGSMNGDKIVAARHALDRFLHDLLDREDEIFLYQFNYEPILVQEWTTDRERLSRALGRIRPRGGTALYDTVAEAVPLAQSGRHTKKALVIISDGNDTNSFMKLQDVRPIIRETEVLVYAVGIDGRATPTLSRRGQPRLPLPIPFPFPIPGRRPRTPFPWPGGGSRSSSQDDRVNVLALRDLTDDSGGRTEIIRSASDLEPATASIADELSRQYYLGYPAPGPNDGQWHSIRVAVRGSAYLVRARRGYVATPLDNQD